jgi:hypothetical protein
MSHSTVVRGRRSEKDESTERKVEDGALETARHIMERLVHNTQFPRMARAAIKSVVVQKSMQLDCDMSHPRVLNVRIIDQGRESGTTPHQRPVSWRVRLSCRL